MSEQLPLSRTCPRCGRRPMLDDEQLLKIASDAFEHYRKLYKLVVPDTVPAALRAFRAEMLCRTGRCRR